MPYEFWLPVCGMSGWPQRTLFAASPVETGVGRASLRGRGRRPFGSYPRGRDTPRLGARRWGGTCTPSEDLQTVREVDMHLGGFSPRS
jgi:hypothetical protein